MWRLIIAVSFIFSLSIVSGYDGIQCGFWTCVNDTNVYCDTSVNQCKCKTGYIGDGRIHCVPDSYHICTLRGDPHIATFNKETSFIFLPCTQLLTQLLIPRRADLILSLKVISENRQMYRANWASQIMAVAIFVEISSVQDNQVNMRCDTNGCRNVSAPYAEVKNHINQSLKFTVTQDTTNGQTVITVEDFGVEIRFRAEDGSVSITTPSDAIPDNDLPGLCNAPTDQLDHNTVRAQGFTMTYDEYILYLNTENINLDYEQNMECRRNHNDACSKAGQRQAVKACGGIYMGDTKQCYFDYRNKNGSAILSDYNMCRSDACTSTYSTNFCTDVVAACGANNKPSVCP